MSDRTVRRTRDLEGVRSLLSLLPAATTARVIPAESSALVVVGIQRQQALEHMLGFRKLLETPVAQTMAMQTAQQRSIVDMAQMSTPSKSGSDNSPIRIPISWCMSARSGE